MSSTRAALQTRTIKRLIIVARISYVDTNIVTHRKTQRKEAKIGGSTRAIRKEIAGPER
jgi:hypothetical protein